MEINKTDEYLKYSNNFRGEFYGINDKLDLQLTFDVSTEDEYEAFINLYNQNYEER